MAARQQICLYIHAAVFPKVIVCLYIFLLYNLCSGTQCNQVCCPKLRTAKAYCIPAKFWVHNISNPYEHIWNSLSRFTVQTLRALAPSESIWYIPHLWCLVTTENFQNCIPLSNKTALNIKYNVGKVFRCDHTILLIRQWLRLYLKTHKSGSAGWSWTSTHLLHTGKNRLKKQPKRSYDT